MCRIFKKNEILTLPNILSFFRLALIPVIAWVYCKIHDYYLAIALILLSGITDVADGVIARKFDMVSDFGKIFDPIADKLTQGILIICLTTKYSLMIPLVILFAVKELIMIIMGCLVIKKHDKVNSAKWYGKANTVLLYIVISSLVFFPAMPDIAANILIIICAISITASLIMYALFYKNFSESCHTETK